MHRFDRVVIDPSRQELDRIFTEAATAANKRCRERLLHWSTDATSAFLRERKKASEGFRQFNAEGERKRRRFTKDRSALAVVWWTDPLGRIHHRIAADRTYTDSKTVENLLCPYHERPHLWLIYPEDLYFRIAGGKEELFAACRCGAMGSPESLGWMGPCCALCHDQAEEGTTPERVGVPAARMVAGAEVLFDGAAFTPDGQNLVFYDRCGFHVRIWDLTTGQVRVTERIAGQVTALALPPDGRIIAVGDRSGNVHLVSPDDAQIQKTLTPGANILDLAFSPDSSLLAMMPYTRVELWDVAAGCLREQIQSGLVTFHNRRYLAFSPDGENLVVDPGGQELLVWNEAKSRTLTIPGVINPSCPAFTPDGRILGMLDESRRVDICLWDMKENRVRAMPKADYPQDFAFSPDSKLMAVAEGEGCLSLYSVDDGRPWASYRWHTSRINAVAFSADGRWLATSGDDGFVKLWPIALFLPK
jgi:sugar lactone lactonase YvrE